MTDAKGKRIFEWGKTALIVVLVLSALLLGWQTGLFNEFFGSLPFFGDTPRQGTPGISGVEFKEAARPLAIVITNENAERYGIKYDTVARNAVYDRMSSILGEALGSASAPMEISEDEWRQALSCIGVYFEYVRPVSLSVLDGWLGVRLPDAVEDAPVRRVFVAFGEDRGKVYYQNSDSELFFVAETATAAGKAQELDVYTPNGTQFSFETGISNAETTPYAILLPGISDHQVVRASVSHSAEEMVAIVIDSMGYTIETSTPRYDSDGKLVRVGIQFNIRADVYGRVMYRRTEILPETGMMQTLNDGGVIERARAIVTEILGNMDSGAEAFYESLEYGERGSRSVVFGYYIAGGRIDLYEDAYAAKVTFVGDTITEMEIVLRSFSHSGEYTRLPRERQAFAAADGEFLLSYSDTGQELLQPFWGKYS